MLRRDRQIQGETRLARGGVSLGAILTGVLVSYGALLILSALVGGVLVATGLDPEDVAAGEQVEVGVGIGIGVLVGQFLAYLWGGYTAGRMARGAGAANGVLVPIVAVIVVVIVAGAAAALGATAELGTPFGATRLPIEGDYVVEWSVAVGAGILLVMLLGGLLGGLAGARWHTRLEEDAMVAEPAVSERAAPPTPPVERRAEPVEAPPAEAGTRDRSGLQEKASALKDKLSSRGSSEERMPHKS
ncbi:MAG: TIGR04086 family membrane protein [Actinomycetota bacterium]